MDDDFDVETWRDELGEKRAEKDAFFADHRQSPVPPEERGNFDGLSYFEPNPTYRVVATVETIDDPEADPVHMDSTAGGEMRYLRAATLSFDLDPADPNLESGSFDLAAYRQEGGEPILFVPFRDKTTGQQTYPGGRYMELSLEGDLADGDELVLDFNLAFTPFCAFSDVYDCPLPPEENWLDVAVPAGERVDDA